MKAIVAGHLCIDLTPALDGRARVQPGELVEIGPLRVDLGGSVANAGRSFVSLGADVSAAAAIGDDALGAIARELLGDAGLQTAGVEIVPGASTSYSVVIQSPGRDRTFWHHAGANERFDADRIAVLGADVLHVGYPSLLARLAEDDGAALERLFRRARAAGVVTSLDLAVIDPASAAAARDWRALLDSVLPETDVFSPSVDDLVSALALDAPPTLELAGELAEEAVAAGAAVAAVSAGAAGTRLATAPAARWTGPRLGALAANWADRRIGFVPPPLSRVVTTNGAGDASSAGLLAGLYSGLSPHQALELAARTAAALIEGAAWVDRSRASARPLVSRES